jgi:biotin synthesis protein BioG
VVKYEWLPCDEREATLIFFAGWCMDPRPFEGLSSRTLDVCVCYDYRDLVVASARSDERAWLLGRSPATWRRAGRVIVVAWSFGCAVAAHAMEAAPWQADEALAINGTVVPEHDLLGVPTALLDATAAGLNELAWSKFVRRMCRHSQARSYFERHAPTRDLTGAAAELAVLRRLGPPQRCRFTRAVVGSDDKIIDPANQRRVWQQHQVPVQTMDLPHYPFYVWQSWERLLAAAGVGGFAS